MFNCYHWLLPKHVTPLGFLCDNLRLTINIPLLTELKCPPLNCVGGEGNGTPLAFVLSHSSPF